MSARALFALAWLVSGSSFAQQVPLEFWALRTPLVDSSAQVLGPAHRWKGETRAPRPLFGVLGAALEQELFHLHVPGEPEFTLELRPVLELELDRFLFLATPVFGFCLGEGARGPASLVHTLKGSYALLSDFSLGLQYEADAGPVGEFLPFEEQSHALLATLDLVIPLQEHALVLGVAFGHGVVGAEAWRGALTLELE